MTVEVLLFFVFSVLTFFGNPLPSNAGQGDLLLYDVARGEEERLSAVLQRLVEKRIILVGEHHTDETHHKAQLTIIRALHERGVPLAVGLEMFRADSQGLLDQWVRGEIGEEAFRRAYEENWGYPWPLYREIFEYARHKKIPLVGLNVPREVTQKVARRGFKSLSEREKGILPFVECKVDPDYMAFIRRAYGAHAHGKLDFSNFCEAQLVWDKAMAIHALRYLESNPDSKMLILAGTGHAWKKGIPEQLRQRSSLPWAAILPFFSEGEDRRSMTDADADYLILRLSK
jgi:uncharacterized iron-regulated protein